MIEKDFYKKIGESSIGNISKYLLNLLFPLVVSKLYGTDILGQYTYGYSIITLVIFLGSLGLDIGLLYFIPRDDNKYITSAFVINFIGSSVIILILFIFIKDNIVRSMLPLIYLLSAEQLFFSIYRVKQKIKEFFLINGIISFTIRIVITAIFFYLFEANPYNIIIATYISVVISIIFYYIQQKNMFGKFVVSKELIFYSLPLIVGSIMSVLMSNTDMIMIGNMLDKKEVGIYKVAAEIATLPSMILIILNTVFPPIISRLYHNNEMDKLRYMYKKSARILSLSSGVIVLIIIIFRKGILSYYGMEFLAGEYVIIFRGIGQLMNASVGSVWYLITMTGRPKVNMIGKILAASLNVVFNIMLIPKFGISGAALASMISVGFVNILGYSIVKRILKVKVFGIV